MRIYKNLPYWTPLFSSGKLGIAWYRWFIWFWTYKENNWTTNFIPKKIYCFRIIGWQFEVRFWNCAKFS